MINAQSVGRIFLVLLILLCAIKCEAKTKHANMNMLIHYLQWEAAKKACEYEMYNEWTKAAIKVQMIDNYKRELKERRKRNETNSGRLQE